MGVGELRFPPGIPEAPLGAATWPGGWRVAGCPCGMCVGQLSREGSGGGSSSGRGSIGEVAGGGRGWAAMIGVGRAKQPLNVVDRSLVKGKAEVHPEFVLLV